MHIEVSNVPADALNPEARDPNSQSSADVRDRVETARQVQIDRAGAINARLAPRQIAEFCTPTRSAQQLLNQALERLGLSARAYHRILKVARTVADLAHSPTIDIPHLTEAISYRRLDRTFPA